MAHKTFTPEEYARILKSEENPFAKPTPPEKTQTVKTRVVEKTTGILEGLTALTLVFWYFFFTGLALLFKRKLPAQWLRLGTRLEKGYIPHLVKKTGLKIEQAKSQPQKIHKKYKVVDLDTQKPVKLPGSGV